MQYLILEILFYTRNTVCSNTRNTRSNGFFGKKCEDCAANTVKDVCTKILCRSNEGLISFSILGAQNIKGQNLQLKKED